MKKGLAIALVFLTTGGCTTTLQGSSKTVVVREAVNELEKETVPGTQHDVWVEPMYDYVRVPGAVDPHNVYYRPSHFEFVEIRPGKYQKQQYPDYNGNYPPK